MGSVNKVQDFSVLTENSLVKVPFDEVVKDDSGFDFDVYTYKLVSATVATVTVTWKSSTKKDFLKAVLS